MVNLHFPMVFLWFSYGSPVDDPQLPPSSPSQTVPGDVLPKVPVGRQEVDAPQGQQRGHEAAKDAAQHQRRSHHTWENHGKMLKISWDFELT